MPQPNVLLLCVDHWPGRLMGCLGHPALTPTLDAMAQNGVMFTNAYSPTPTCVPARRELFTGTAARTHGDRVFAEKLLPPTTPTMAQVFRDAGYQAYAVGKMHVYPQRARIGFDEIILNEEGRHQFGMKADDYELYLAEQGYAGQELTHAMGNNEYTVRPWHLPEHCHQTIWTAREMCRVIKRRDPTRPAFWYCSFSAPHPPLTPPRDYLEMYRHLEIDKPYVGEWAKDFDKLPYALRLRRNWPGQYTEAAIDLARRAFYAQCTLIDHQIRLLIGMLREEGLSEDTIVLLTCDHGDMLGNHNLYAKGIFYEDSAKVPMLLVPNKGNEEKVGWSRRDNRLAALCDVMPTLLEMCGVPVPAAVEGLSLIGERRREHLYGEHYENDLATRMVHDGRHKLIYYAVGNRTQLFDLQKDPNEMVDVSESPAYAGVRTALTDVLMRHLYGGDLDWVQNGRLVGLPDREHHARPNRGLSGQRGWRFMGG